MTQTEMAWQDVEREIEQLLRYVTSKRRERRVLYEKATHAVLGVLGGAFAGFLCGAMTANWRGTWFASLAPIVIAAVACVPWLIYFRTTARMDAETKVRESTTIGCIPPEFRKRAEQVFRTKNIDRQLCKHFDA